MRLLERLAAPLLFFLLAVLSLALSAYAPSHNWDMIGYMAAAKSFEERDFEALHSFTFDQLRQSVPDATYQLLTESSSYSRAIGTDSSAFREQLPFYQIRPVYTGLTYLLYKAGVNIGFATHMISGVAIAIAIAFLYLMSVSFLERPLVYAVPALAIVFGLLDLARYSTPDALAALAVILSAYLFLRKRATLLLLLLPFMLGIRTDLILFTVPLLLLMFVFEKSIRWKTALSILMSVAIYIAMGVFWENPGWATTFYVTFVQFLPHPISMPPRLTPQDYIHALFIGTVRLLVNSTFILYVLVAAYSLYSIRTYAKITSVNIAFRSSSAILAVVCLVFVTCHFLAFPTPWTRFFAGQYLVGAFMLLIMMAGYFKATTSAQ